MTPTPPIAEPTSKRCVAFFDGQNLFHGAKEAFGYPFPNYDPTALSHAVCKAQGWKLAGIRFYTGIPSPAVDPKRHHFWMRKLQVMGTRGVRPFTRELRYQNTVVTAPNGALVSAQVGREKGIDVRIALDVVRLALERTYDVGLIFSQDQDLAEVATEVRAIARKDNRWIKLASAFPVSPTYANRRGINGTDWIQIDKTTYDSCIDPQDYRK